MAKPHGAIEDGLGSFLRQEREARGIPLGDVAKQTRIRNFYLEIIETGEYGRLPSVPIGRGFVRAYASAIGVDSDAAARQFDREFGTAQQQVKQAELSAEKIAFSHIAQRTASQRLWLPFAAVAALIGVSGVLFWSLRGKTERYVPVTSFSERLKAAAGPMLKQMPLFRGPEKASPAPREARPAPAVQKPAPEPQSRGSIPAERAVPLSVSAAKRNGERGDSSPTQPSAAQGAGSSAALAPVQPPRPEAPVTPSNASPGPSVLADRLALKIRALEDTWVRIVVDQREIQEFLLTAGNERFWKGSERFILTVGNASGTQVSLNGSSISLPQSSSNVVRDFVITEKLLN
ncbi:MAG: hypothetical protein A3J27_03200 [Candidatus Tectomicrobia bacterium RIFCSPLOWO2_12_FULL_69_37]|nr:MAG: hypothetical protein A3J27_03200 [Candidatus Tectomicrobia bacterium RIFCSPLOWO2_12_FULL_69_37]OGL64103.1 MAG: hypothetical protein A3I72_08370 [Candidatus Tectomicrobia bacterium RIFCSPLOWO2_02_FULL_70_19]